VTDKIELNIAKIIDEAEDVPPAAGDCPTDRKVKGKSTQVDTLIELAGAADLFRTPDGQGYADIEVNGHRETWALNSQEFAKWMRHEYYEMTESAPSHASMVEACRTLEAKAQFKSPIRPVHLRIAEFEGRLFLDLADEDWRVIEITSRGWQLVSKPTVRFRRTKGMRPLPQHGGSIDDLARFINVQSGQQFVLAVAWVLACLRNRGPYPVLAVTGEQGSAKSSFSRMLRDLVDPNAVPLRALPRSERDVHIAASNGHVLAFDNVSRVPHWLSDTFCQIATGGGFATRELYTNGDEKLFNPVFPR
jgi:hypothetical protein